jgi:hypothetical protein
MLTARAAIAAAVACACVSVSHARPVTLLDSRSYPTLEVAALAALAAALPLSERFEYGGVIAECLGSYHVSTPVTNRDEVHVEYEVRIPRGCQLAALYHTHPSNDGRPTRFSPDDVNTARTLGVPSFIGVWADRSVRLFDPSMVATKDYGRLSAGSSARGVLLTTLEY